MKGQDAIWCRGPDAEQTRQENQIIQNPHGFIATLFTSKAKASTKIESIIISAPTPF